MNYKIIYSSQTGNTRLLAETAASVLKLKIKGNDTLEITDIQTITKPLKPSPDDTIYFIGFWTDKGNCGESIKNTLKSLENCKVFLFGTAGFGQSQDYFERLLGNAAHNLPSTSTLIGTFMCQGKMPQSVRSRYKKMLEEKPGDTSIQRLLDNFDAALLHPSEDDQHRLAKAINASLKNC